MNNLKAILHYEFAGTKRAASIFWIILASTLFLSIIFALTVTEGDMYLGGTSIALLTYMVITGFITVKESLPYCIRHGASRSQFLIGTAVSFLLTSVVMAFIHTILVELAIIAGKLLDLKNMHFFRAADLLSKNPSLLTTTVIDAFLFFFGLSSAFFIGTLVFRFGLKAGFILPVLTLPLFLPIVQEKLGEFTESLANGAGFTNFFTFFIAGVICFAAAWPIIRKMSIHPSSQ